jgi:hypothetical protein
MGRGCGSWTMMKSWSCRWFLIEFSWMTPSYIRHFREERLMSSPCRALCIFLVMLKKSGAPWITRHPVFTPVEFMSRVSGERISATPPP